MYAIYDTNTGIVSGYLSSAEGAAPGVGQAFLEITEAIEDGCVFYVDSGALKKSAKLVNPHHIFDYTTKQWMPNPESAWSSVRQQRNQLLKDSDFTQLSDSPKNKRQWATYRQALRDVTQQGDAWAIVWPVEPT